MTKQRMECLLVDAIDIIDVLFKHNPKYKEMYHSTYRYLQAKIEVDDSELEEIGIDVESLKEEI